LGREHEECCVTRIALVAPVLALRVGLSALLDAAGLEVHWQAGCLAEVEPHLGESDVLVVCTGGISGSELRTLLKSSGGRLALLLLVEGAQEIPDLRDLALRAWGMLPLEATGAELAAAIQALDEGLLVSAPALAQLSPGRSAAGSIEEGGPLTGRELEVLQHLAQGLANKQIGAALGISEHTVKFHVASIYAKLGAANRAEAVRLGVQSGLVVL